MRHMLLQLYTTCYMQERYRESCAISHKLTKMTDNQPDNKKITKKDDTKQVADLTDKNWLFLKHIETGISVKEAYKLAGYTGTSLNSPYEFYSRLKKRLEIVYTADNIDSLRLKMRANKILSMPIKEEEVSVRDHLKAIELTAKLTEDKTLTDKVISPFIIFKAPDGKLEAVEGKVVDVTPIDVTPTESSD